MSEFSPSDSIALPEDWNISHADLKLGSELGRGSFGSSKRPCILSLQCLQHVWIYITCETDIMFDIWWNNWIWSSLNRNIDQFVLRHQNRHCLQVSIDGRRCCRETNQKWIWASQWIWTRSRNVKVRYSPSASLSTCFVCILCSFALALRSN